MNKLNEIAAECGFTTKDEVVKLLFLIHNQESRVRNELLKNLTPHVPYKNGLVGQSVLNQLFKQKL